MDKIIDIILEFADCLWFIDVSKASNRSRQVIRILFYVVAVIALGYLIFFS